MRPRASQVDAVEIFDRRSLALSEENNEMVALCPELVGLPGDEEAAALLIECRGEDPDALAASIDSVCAALTRCGAPVLNKSGYVPGAFKHEPADYNVFWDMRKGLIPIVGGRLGGRDEPDDPHLSPSPSPSPSLSHLSPLTSHLSPLTSHLSPPSRGAARR